jgi:hypothetical protein
MTRKKMIERTEEPQGFADFWNVWRPHARHTDGRKLARDTYEKHINFGANPQDIIDGATYFFRSMKERDRDFVPLASTWLNRESYADLCEQERAYQDRKQQREAKEATATVISLPANHFQNRYRSAS